MKEMQIFENQEFGAVRTVELDGELWMAARMSSVAGFMV